MIIPLCSALKIYVCILLVLKKKCEKNNNKMKENVETQTSS